MNEDHLHLDVDLNLWAVCPGGILATFQLPSISPIVVASVSLDTTFHQVCGLGSTNGRHFLRFRTGQRKKREREAVIDSSYGQACKLWKRVDMRLCQRVLGVLLEIASFSATGS